MIDWESDAPKKFRIRIQYIAAFNAHGMRRIYGRSDYVGRKAAFNMDIWQNRNDQILARFWSRNSDVDTQSIAIHGIPAELIPKRDKDDAFSDAWIVMVIRDAYEQWISEEFS